MKTVKSAKIVAIPKVVMNLTPAVLAANHEVMWRLQLRKRNATRSARSRAAMRVYGLTRRAR